MMIPGRDGGWFTYLLECSDGSLYAGICTDLERRLAEHTRGDGARYTRAFPPRRMVAAWSCPDRSTASRLEYCIKSMRTEQKRNLAHNRRRLCPLQDLWAVERLSAGQLPRGAG